MGVFMKNIKKITLISFICLLFSVGIVLYFNYFQGFVTIKDNKIQFSNLPTSDFTSCYTSNIKFEDTSEKIVSNIHINILENSLPDDIIIIEKSQRYYIPIESICKSLNYSISSNGNIITLRNNNYEIIITDNNCTINDKLYKLRGRLLTYENSSYISISDIEYIFNLTACFNTENNTINFLDSLSSPDGTKEQPSEGKIALIRLEDFSAGADQLKTSTQIKYKIMGSYLFNEGIKYHIAWVPRYKCPSEEFDNDLLSNECFENVGFVNVLDYFINHGGEIGLHGYTHQFDDSTSLTGTELSNSINSSESATRNVIESAIDTATALNIPYSFFESPHYKATQSQKNIIEEYFKYIYEPRNILIYTKIQKRNNSLYIPTPLNYIKDLDVSPIKKKLKNPTPGQLASLFYHPYLELDFINFSISANTININYDENSPLKQIVNSIQDNKYITCHVSDLK